MIQLASECRFEVKSRPKVLNYKNKNKEDGLQKSRFVKGIKDGFAGVKPLNICTPRNLNCTQVYA